jgi:integrase
LVSELQEVSAWTKVGGSQNDGLYRHSVTGIIKFRKYREGKGEIDRSCRTRDLTLARRKRDEFMAEIWGDKPKINRRSTTGALWVEWRNGKAAANKRQATMDSIDSTWKNLEPFAADLFPDEITEQWWLGVYIPKMRERPHPRTGLPNPKRKFMNDRKWLVSFLKSLHRQGVIAKLPHIINPDPARDEGKVYSDEVMAKLYDAADWSLFAKLVMGAEHFMRRWEIGGMSKARINRTDRIIYLRAEDTKIKKPRAFAYNEALEWIFMILDAKSETESPWLFPSPKDPMNPIRKDGFMTAWRAAKKRAGLIGKANFHWLRHTGLSKAFAAPGANPALICHAAGLSLDEAQKTYLHYGPEDTRNVTQLVRF